MLRRALLELGLARAVAPPAARATSEGDAAAVGFSGAVDVRALPSARATIVLDGALLASRVARAERVGLLSVLRSRLAPGGTLVVAIAIAEGVAPWGRLVLDAPRVLLPRRLGLPERGARFPAAAGTHVYYASTEVEDEANDAGLALASHRDGAMTFVSGAPAARARESDDRKLVLALVRAEVLRRKSPRDALAAARARGAGAAPRTADERRRLHARLGWLDGFVPPGPNCLRRVLAETMLDRDAALERVILSLDVGSTGHAHFPSDPQGPPRAYDVAFEV